MPLGVHWGSWGRSRGSRRDTSYTRPRLGRRRASGATRGLHRASAACGRHHVQRFARRIAWLPALEHVFASETPPPVEVPAIGAGRGRLGRRLGGWGIQGCQRGFMVFDGLPHPQRIPLAGHRTARTRALPGAPGVDLGQVKLAAHGWLLLHASITRRHVRQVTGGPSPVADPTSRAAKSFTRIRESIRSQSGRPGGHGGGASACQTDRPPRTRGKTGGSRAVLMARLRTASPGRRAPRGYRRRTIPACP